MAMAIEKAKDPFTKAKKGTYDAFMRLTMTLSVLIALLLLGMLVFLV